MFIINYFIINYYMDANKTTGEKLDGNYTRMLRAILNMTWQQHPTRH